MPGQALQCRVDANLTFRLPSHDFEIGIAEPHNDLHAQARQLIAALYQARGLGVPDESLLSAAPAFTLVARREDRVFGTMTLRIDQGAGLLADGLYGDVIDKFRGRGAKVCEVTGLALDVEHSSHQALASLFNVAFVLARAVYGCSDSFAEVNPRHGVFYRRSMGYQVEGPVYVCPRVNAPAVLLRLDLAFAEAQIAALAGQASGSSRSLYSLFLPPIDNQSLRDRLILLNRAQHRTNSAVA